MITVHREVTISVNSVELTLLPSRTVWHEAAQALFLADTHFGKAATMRRAGMPIPAGTTRSTLARLSAAIDSCHPRQLVVLGDLVHSNVAAGEDFETELMEWRRSYPQLEIMLVKGNHDRRKSGFYDQFEIQLVQEPFTLDDLTLCHDAMRFQCNGFRLGGHHHPGITIPGLGSGAVPCFYRQSHSLTLPAFGAFTGCSRVRMQPGELCYAVADGALIETRP